MASISVRITARNFRRVPKQRRSNSNNLKTIKILKTGPSQRKIIPKCMVINIRSLAKPDALPALTAELLHNNIDVCFITETWLHKCIPSSLVCPRGYTIVRKDRDPRPGGGVAILCRNDWKITNVDLDNNFECIWCEIHTMNSFYCVAVLYHPPDPTYNESDLLDFLSDYCEKILSSQPNANIIIAGDVNQLRVHDFRIQHNLDQIVNKPTRGTRILDIFLTNNPHIWKVPIVFRCSVRSDHSAVVVTPQQPAKPERKVVYFRDVRYHRKIKMENKLEVYDWSRIYNANIDNVDEGVELLNETLCSMYNECFPLIKVKMSNRDPPFMSPLVKHLCNIRNRELQRGVNTDLQQKINKLIRENQVKAIQNDKTNYKQGSRGWWKTVNQITGRGSRSENVSNIIDPERMNSHFQDINTDKEYVRPVPLRIPEGTRVPIVDIKVVENFMRRQKQTSPGPDGIPYWIWRDFASYLAPVITNVLNSSLKQQRVPSLWKLANLNPLPKESPLIECNQLRPISLTNVIIRLLERIIFEEEIRHLSKLIIDKHQYAYKQNSNTTAALIKSQHHWLKWLDDKANYVRVISFDFSKAFDSVPHDILTQKLKSTNLNPYIINWLINFISCRKQRVPVDGIVTNFVNINRGVPQGTVLGPFLFSLMVSDIEVKHPQTNILIKFADDLTVSAPVTSSGDSALDEVTNIESWANNNRMILNYKKTSL